MLGWYCLCAISLHVYIFNQPISITPFLPCLHPLNTCQLRTFETSFCCTSRYQQVRISLHTHKLRYFICIKPEVTYPPLSPVAYIDFKGGPRSSIRWNNVHGNYNCLGTLKHRNT